MHTAAIYKKSKHIPEEKRALLPILNKYKEAPSGMFLWLAGLKSSNVLTSEATSLWKP
jgi:hypothetical protein